ncbi:MAG: hypothetical protein APF77_17180 [Clostridia bacterium BRH_c25]|nr:MAG: hypothetical protein APF77_17180 [Clostridia bacterium BRH_c25]
MSEKYKVESFNKELDALLKGVYKADQPGNADELQLVEKILKEDFSDESQLKQKTKKRLLDKINARKSGKQGQGYSTFDEDELSEEELDYASGGLAIREEGVCSKCDCKRSRVSISTAKCPECGHSRDDHM